MSGFPLRAAPAARTGASDDRTVIEVVVTGAASASDAVVGSRTSVI
jgi:hypothetical protein